MMRNFSKKPSFLFVLGTIASVGIISFHLTSSSSVPESQGGEDALSVLPEEQPAPLLSIATHTGGTSTYPSSRSLGIEVSCGDGRTAARVATGLGAAAAGVIAAAAGGATKAVAVASGGLFGAGNAFTSLWSCPGFSLESAEELERMVKDYIDDTDAERIARQFGDIEKDIFYKCGDLRYCTHACLKGVTDDLNSRVLGSSNSAGANINASQILIAATLEYVRIMGIYMIRRTDFSASECGETSRKYVQEIHDTVDAVQNARDKLIAEAEADIYCHNRLRTVFPSNDCSVVEICEVRGDSGTKDKFDKVGIYPRSFDEWKRNESRSCSELRENGDPPPSGTVKAAIMKRYEDSAVFEWWRSIAPDLQALKQMKKYSANDVSLLCGKGLCPNEDGRGCYCNSNDDCGDSLSCANNVCECLDPDGLGCNCLSDQDCGGSLACRDNVCRNVAWWCDRCNSDADCCCREDAYFCSYGRCINQNDLDHSGGENPCKDAEP